MSGGTTDIDATLTASLMKLASPTGHVFLKATYTLTNTGSVPLLVILERGHEQSSGSPADRTEAAAWVGGVPKGGPAGGIQVSKRIYPVPAGVQLAQSYRAPARLVAPGEKLTGIMSVSLDRGADLPGEPLVADEGRMPSTATTARICLDVDPDPRSRFPEIPITEITTENSGRRLVCTADLPLSKYAQ